MKTKASESLEITQCKPRQSTPTFKDDVYRRIPIDQQKPAWNPSTDIRITKRPSESIYY